jgi:hypothetical protein
MNTTNTTNITNTITRTQVNEMKLGWSLAEQTPFMPERQLWEEWVFKPLILWMPMVGISIENRSAFRALGLTCKALHEIFLPLEIDLLEREASHIDRNNNRLITCTTSRGTSCWM